MKSFTALWGRGFGLIWPCVMISGQDHVVCDLDIDLHWRFNWLDWVGHWHWTRVAAILLAAAANPNRLIGPIWWCCHLDSPDSPKRRSRDRRPHQSQSPPPIMMAAAPRVTALSLCHQFSLHCFLHFFKQMNWDSFNAVNPIISIIFSDGNVGFKCWKSWEEETLGNDAFGWRLNAIDDAKGKW